MALYCISCSFSATLNKFINYDIESIAQFGIFQLNMVNDDDDDD